MSISEACMQHYITKLSSNGRVVLPVEVREQLNLQDGDRLVVDVKDNVIRLSTFKSRAKHIQEVISKKAGKKRLVEELKKLRNEDETSE